MTSGAVVPRCQVASTAAGSSIQSSVTSGRPLTRTTTTGVPVDTAAWTSSS